jgi:hypothetical protein
MVECRSDFTSRCAGKNKKPAPTEGRVIKRKNPEETSSLATATDGTEAKSRETKDSRVGGRLGDGGG